MNNLITKEVNFQGANLLAVQDQESGKIHVGVSYICNGIGLTKSQKDTQVQKVQGDEVLNRGCLKFQAGVIDPNNEVLAIELNFLPLWLAKISITPRMQAEQPEVANNLIEYQLKAKDVLAEAFIKKQPQPQPKTPNLASANNTVKILGTMMEKAGIEPDIQLLTAKTVYAQAGIDIPLLIEADQKYYDTAYIAKKVGMSVKKSGKPAVTAVSQLIKSLPLEESETKVFFEGKDNWQGSVTKYSESVIEKVRNWLVENGYPTIIEGESKNYHVVYDTYDVA